MTISNTNIIPALPLLANRNGTTRLRSPKHTHNHPVQRIEGHGLTDDSDQFLFVVVVSLVLSIFLDILNI